MVGGKMKQITLTIEEIRDLAKFCGMVITEPTANEKEDERETEITIETWPEKGVLDDCLETLVPTRKYIAYFDEYPEEGCCPLGSPITPPSTQPASKPQPA